MFNQFSNMDHNDSDVLKRQSQWFDSSLSSYRLSLLYPSHHTGAKVPSEMPQPSATAALKYNFNITVGALSNFLIVYDPTVGVIRYATNPIGDGTAPSFTDFILPQDSNIIDMWRTVSLELRLTYVGQIQTLSGFLTGAVCSNYSATDDTIWNTFQNIEDIENKKTVNPIQGLRLLYFPQDSTMLEYYKQSDYPTVSPWTGNAATRRKLMMIVYGQGLPSTTCLRVDIFRNIEYQSKPALREYIKHDNTCSQKFDKSVVDSVANQPVKALNP